jgi:hypothetical protein
MAILSEVVVRFGLTFNLLREASSHQKTFAISYAMHPHAGRRKNGCPVPHAVSASMRRQETVEEYCHATVSHCDLDMPGFSGDF